MPHLKSLQTIKILDKLLLECFFFFFWTGDASKSFHFFVVNLYFGGSQESTVVLILVWSSLWSTGDNVRPDLPRLSRNQTTQQNRDEKAPDCLECPPQTAPETVLPPPSLAALSDTELNLP